MLEPDLGLRSSLTRSMSLEKLLNFAKSRFSYWQNEETSPISLLIGLNKIIHII